MIKYIKGNILESEAEALVNTVNTNGVMSKGIALQFKKTYPDNFKAYVNACKSGKVSVGKMFVFRDKNLLSGAKIIINFPTKTDWRKPSEYSYIEAGLTDLLNIIDAYNIKSIAIPPLGSGNGGLEWEKVKRIIDKRLSSLKTDVFVYEPADKIKELLKKERVKLTDARAMLLYVLYDLVKNGEYVSEFSSEKICYFMQRFGAEKYLRLKFKPYFYGPYSGKVRHILQILNGSYIMGYSDMNKRPFEPLMLVKDGYDTVLEYINKSDEIKKITLKTTEFLTGFYSDFALELLSSVDYIANKNGVFDRESVIRKINEWSDRKRSMFSNQRYIDIALDKIKTLPFQGVRQCAE